MAKNQAWICKVKSEFENSPLVSNVFFGFVLLGLEKLVEVEFACPCNPKWNALFTAAYFIVPALLAFLLMINTRACKSKKMSKECGKNVFFSIVPAIVWFILLFFDGQYFACAMTSWSGRFVIVEEAAPQKWCYPKNHTTSQELMIKTQGWFSLSQGIGMGLIIFFTIAFGIYLIYNKCFKKEDQVQGEGVSPGQVRNNQDPEAPVPTNQKDMYSSRVGIPDSGHFLLQDINQQ